MKFKKGHHGEQDFELNLAPIIDALTVLVTFMLASTAFITIGILDAGIAAGASASTPSTTPPPISISIEIQKANVIEIVTRGKDNRTLTIQPKGQELDLAGMTNKLKELKNKYPTVEAATLKAENLIAYKFVIQTMNETRKTLPAVLLGGF